MRWSRGSQVAHLVRAPIDELFLCHNARKAPMAIARSGEPYPPADQHLLHNISPCKAVLNNKLTWQSWTTKWHGKIESTGGRNTVCKEHISILNNDKGNLLLRQQAYLLRHACNCSWNLAGGRPTEPAWQQSSFPCVTRPQNLPQHGCWKQQHKEWFYSTWVLEARSWRGCLLLPHVVTKLASHHKHHWSPWCQPVLKSLQ